VSVAPQPGQFTFVEGLYALSRVLDTLLEMPDAYAAFMTAMACSRISEDCFHPFFHEIVTVAPAEDHDQPPVLRGEHWPGYLAGSMLLVRAGVSVEAGGRVLDPDVATRSCLYWAWRRHNRPVIDQSRGWGSNSQWGTSFRRDYWVEGELRYKVDARGSHGSNLTSRRSRRSRCSAIAVAPRSTSVTTSGPGTTITWSPARAECARRCDDGGDGSAPACP
jgi:hypothetical protein